MKKETLRAELPEGVPEVYSSHLAMGGRGADGTCFGINNMFLTKNGKPWIPVMGEFHFSRYPREFWRDELEKMKALGVDIVSSYIFWIHHEEEQGVWDWRGNKELGAFVRLCGELELLFWLRIGPWPHGECRNGGFPDWLMELGKKRVKLRSDDREYLSHVRRFYEEIGRQIGPEADIRKGGPVIGVQIENEYGHCGGSGTEGHILTLQKMARDAGITAPYYSVTGWGGANVPQDKVIPAMGGYPAYPWTQHADPLEPMREYLFIPLSNDPRIGGDLADEKNVHKEDLTWDPERTPYITCELGGGIHVTDHRRPHILRDDVSAICLCTLGCGCNLPGYYMFHGGTQPKGKLTGMQESKESGSPNDVAPLTYDFQAMISEYGEIRPSALRNKLYHYFLRDFGSQLAPLPPFFPPESPFRTNDRENLRWSVRSDGTKGFLFLNNHSRLLKLDERKSELVVEGPEGEIAFPPVKIGPGKYGFFPFNMEIGKGRGKALIKKATVQPVGMVRDEEGDVMYFLNFLDEPGLIEWTADKGKKTKSASFGRDSVRIKAEPGLVFHILSPEKGDRLWLGETDGMRKALFSDSPVLFERDGAYTLEEEEIKEEITPKKEGFAYTFDIKNLKGRLKESDELILEFRIECDKAFLEIAGETRADLFYYGAPWRVGLKRFSSLIEKDPALKLRLEKPEPGRKVYFDVSPPKKVKMEGIGIFAIRKRKINGDLHE